jgi:nucleoside-diphosphate-sugar epimerase
VDPVAGLLEALGARLARVVYLSTTGVHGAAAEVDETTPPAPQTPGDEARLAAERAVLGGPWSGLVLRPAAIYGPHRGAHALLRSGGLARLARLDRVVSRIQVEDLAALCEAALASGTTGAFPVADDQPASTLEVARFAARLLGLPEPGDPPPLGPDAVAGPPREGAIRGDRRVDGRAVRRVLGVALRYPTYREGLPAALREEQALAGPGRAT